MNDRRVSIGGALILAVSVTAPVVTTCSNNVAQLFVTGPNFKFECSIVLGETLMISVTGFALRANAGNYYAVVE